MDFILPECGTQFGNNFVWDSRPMIPKMDDPSYVEGVMHHAPGFLPIKPGEDVAGKQGFCHPSRSFPRRAPKANAREKNLHVFQKPEARSRNVLMFAPGAQAEPRCF